MRWPWTGHRHRDIGYPHTQCRVMTSRDTGRLVVEALSGYENGKVRQHGGPERTY